MSKGIASVADLTDEARRRLPRFLHDFIAGGAYSEETLAANRDSLRAITLRPRVMRDVSEVELSTTLLRTRAPMPVALGPIGMAGICARRGEVMAARAAEAQGIPFCLSTVSVCALAEVARAVTRPFWFQLYMVRDRGFMAELLAEAERHCSALVFTVDMPTASIRYRDFRSSMSGSPGKGGALRRAAQAIRRPAWAWNVGLRGRPHRLGNLAPVIGKRGGTEDFVSWLGANFDPTVTWRDLDFVREHWSGPLAIKGIMDPDDADAAIGAGTDAVIVSNHGGRQMDGVAGTAAVLPCIAERVAGRTQLLADGGVRSGIDVLKMLALGADGVLLGRAWAYALAARGEAGVAAMLATMRSELTAGMKMTGCRDLGSVREALMPT